MFVAATSFLYQASLNAIGPLVTAVVGLLLVGLVVNFITRQRRTGDRLTILSTLSSASLRRRQARCISTLRPTGELAMPMMARPGLRQGDAIIKNSVNCERGC